MLWHFFEKSIYYFYALDFLGVFRIWRSWHCKPIVVDRNGFSRKEKATNYHGVDGDFNILAYNRIRILYVAGQRAEPSCQKHD